MDDQDQHYDVSAAQDKWRKVWDDLDPFRPARTHGSRRRATP